MTIDVKKGMEHGLLGIKDEEPPPPPPPDPNKKKRGRPRKIKLSPEEQAEVDAENRRKLEEARAKKVCHTYRFFCCAAVLLGLLQVLNLYVFT